MQLQGPAHPLEHPSTAEDALFQLMMTAGRRFRARDAADAVDPAQSSLLYVLKCHGAMRLGDLAEAMHLDASTVSRHVQQLADKELIAREPDPDDGRARIIAITRRGRQAMKGTMDRRRAVLTRALEDFSPEERDQLRGLLDRVIGTLLDQSETDAATPVA